MSLRNEILEMQLSKQKAAIEPVQDRQVTVEDSDEGSEKSVNTTLVKIGEETRHNW